MDHNFFITPSQQLQLFDIENNLGQSICHASNKQTFAFKANLLNNKLSHNPTNQKTITIGDALTFCPI
jgi:hypothetical protein